MVGRLKRWDKMLARAWARVSRGKKLALNLTLCALIGLLIWMRLGYPLPTAELEFRRLERTHLLPRSEIVFRSDRADVFPVENGPELRFSTQFFVGLREDRVTVCAMEKYRDGQWDRAIVSLPRGEGPELIPLLREGAYLEPVAWQRVQISENHVGTTNYIVLLLLNPPAETARVEVTVRDDKEECSGGGWRMEDGNWLLGLRSGLLGRGIIPYQNASYTLKLFGADDTLLLERSGSFGAA